MFPELVQEIGSEPVDVVLAIWRQTGGLFLRNHMPLLDEFVHDFTLVMDIHKDQNVGHQMPILDDLALLIARIGGNDTPVAECDELNKVVEPLADGGGVIHGSSEFWLSQVFKQIGAANDLSELLKCIVQFILPGSVGQSSKYE